MPQSVAEVGAGAQFSRSTQENQVADTLTRTFRIILSSPQEYLDIQRACGVFIGQVHPAGVELTCVSFDARYEGESRMVVLATFNYQTNPGQRKDDKRDPPPTRAANWSTSSTLAEVPKSVWLRRSALYDWDTTAKAAINPAGDMYDGITALEPVVSISIEQWEAEDPTKHLMHAGSVNLEEITLGSLKMKPGTVMFRGVTSQPAVESWGESTFRGWRCAYEFAYRRNPTRVTIAGVVNEVDLGWDIAVPLSGFNCRAFVPGNAAANEDVWGQPLQHTNGRIIPPLLLPNGTDPGERVRAMVKVPDYDDKGTSQAPSASPIALKENGRPLKTHDADGNLINDPIVHAYRVQPAINITNTLQLRLY